jgi:DNA-binding SARP family transcriptional activator
MKKHPSVSVPDPQLVTLGTPALVVHGAPIHLRKKDLALLVYLRLEGRHGHSRGALAGLLWGNSPEENARHSLTQALGRLRRRLGDVLEVGHDRVGCRATLPCDAAALQEAAAAPQVDDAVLALCAGEFLAGFHAGSGAEAFETWADGRRAHLRTVAVSALDRLGAAAQARGDWSLALAAGQRATELDPASEPGHRRMMRAWNAQGHRLRALQHYERLAGWLAAEFETDPEPETALLAEQLRSRTSSPPRTEPPPAAPGPVRLAEPAEPERESDPADSEDADAARRSPPPRPRPRIHWAWGGVAGLAVLLALLWNSGALLGVGGVPDATTEERSREVPPPVTPAGSPTPPSAAEKMKDCPTHGQQG